MIHWCVIVLSFLIQDLLAQETVTVRRKHIRITGHSAFDALAVDYLKENFGQAGEAYVWYNFDDPEIRSNIPPGVTGVAANLYTQVQNSPTLNIVLKYQIHRLLGVIAYWNHHRGSVDSRRITKLLDPINELTKAAALLPDAATGGRIEALLHSVHDLVNLELVGILGLSKKLVPSFLDQISTLINTRAVNRELIDSLLSLSESTAKKLEEKILVTLKQAINSCHPNIYGDLLAGFDCHIEKYFSENFGPAGLLYVESLYSGTKWMQSLKSQDAKIYQLLRKEAKKILDRKTYGLLSDSRRTRYRLHRFLGILEFVKTRHMLPSHSYVVDYHTAWCDPESRRAISEKLQALHHTWIQVWNQPTESSLRDILRVVMRDSLVLIGRASWSPNQEVQNAFAPFPLIELTLSNFMRSAYKSLDKLAIIQSVMSDLCDKLTDRISRFDELIIEAQRRVQATMDAFQSTRSITTAV